MFCTDQDTCQCSKGCAMPGLSRLLSGIVIWPSQALDSGTLSWLRTLAVWGWISFQHWHRKTLSNHYLTFRHILNINQGPKTLGDNRCCIKSTEIWQKINSLDFQLVLEDWRCLGVAKLNLLLQQRSLVTDSLDLQNISASSLVSARKYTSTQSEMQILTKRHHCFGEHRGASPSICLQGDLIFILWHGGFQMPVHFWQKQRWDCSQISCHCHPSWMGREGKTVYT